MALLAAPSALSLHISDHRRQIRRIRRVSGIVSTALLLVFSLKLTSAQAGGNAPGGNPPSGGMPDNSSTNPVLTAACGEVTLDGETGDTTPDQAYDSTADDTSVICLINGSTLTLENPTITRSGDTSSGDQSSFYGLNAAALAGSGSTLTISGGMVTTEASGTNGVFATDDGSSVVLSDLMIDANGDGAHAVMATLGGAMTLTDTDLTSTLADKWGVMIYQSFSGDAERTHGIFSMTGGSLANTAATGMLVQAGATDRRGAEAARST